MKNNFLKKQKGMLIVQVLVFSGIMIAIIAALSSWASVSIKAGRTAHHKEQAIQTAEAGIDYYRWHLAHSPTDYQDGTGVAGPYVHDLEDKDGNVVGQFSLDITPPSLGSTLVSIESSGTATGSSAGRKILSRVAKPSIAKYAFAGHNSMRFGEGTEVFGPIHVNGGIRFDGLAHNIVTSASTTYDDADHTGNNEIGVHTHVNAPPSSGVNDAYRSAEANPSSIPSRTDVFEAGRLISQPSIDFAGFTTDLAILKTNAQLASGFYRGVAGGSNVGYRVLLRTDGTFRLYRINSWAGLGNCSTQSPNTSSWSINSQTLLGTYAYPTNGIIFIEDNVVVEGQINGNRLTIVAADLINPIVNKNIIINNDVLYTYYDGTDTLGLIGQGAITVGMISDTDLQIDGALIAQNDRIGRPYFSGGSCTYRNRNSISLYGMIASYMRYGFSWTDGTGYATRNINYDANLLYAPPPNFPITSDQYEIISWQEVTN